MGKVGRSKTEKRKIKKKRVKKEKKRWDRVGQVAGYFSPVNWNESFAKVSIRNIYLSIYMCVCVYIKKGSRNARFKTISGQVWMDCFECDRM